MIDKIQISNISSVRSLIRISLAKELQHVVLSPGSRNAPLIISFNAIEQFKCQSILDERTAGFVALGLAQGTKRPVLLSCTSGSAILNYTPALVEAYYQRVPLIAVTADRPLSRIDQGEGQSIRQDGAMSQVVAQTFNLVDAQTDQDEWYNERLINEAFEVARLKSRPVQINIPLDEPLYELADFDFASGKSFNWIKSQPTFSSSDAIRLKSEWKNAEKIVVLVTQANGEGLSLELLKKINEDPRVAVLTETTANMHHLGFVACIDRTIDGLSNQKDASAFIPDLLVTIGQNVISKKLKSLFRKNKHLIKHHWHFGDEVLDTFERLTALLEGSPNQLFEQLVQESYLGDSGFGTRWKERYFRIEQLHNEFVATCEWSDLSAFRWILDYIPDGSQVQMGNSSVVRYIQLFSPVFTLNYNGNRGVSGIEGCTSTAVGVAQATEKTVVLVSGDQAFRYDSNALAVKENIENLRIIVINNGGGNIFRIIDGPKGHQVSEKFIERADSGTMENLVAHHGCEYLRAHDEATLETGLVDLFDIKREKPTVLEVFTPRLESPEILKAYFSSLNREQAE